MGLEAAVEATADFLKKAVKPILVAGPKVRVAKACQTFVEDHKHFIGTFWGAVSTALCAEIIESANTYFFTRPIFNDCSYVGYSLLLKKEKSITVEPDRVVIGNGPTFGCVLMKDFLSALEKRVKRNNTAYENYFRIFVSEGLPVKSEPREPLRVNVLIES